MNMRKIASGEGADEALKDVLDCLRAQRERKAADPRPQRRYRWQYQNSNFGMGL